MCFWYRTLLLQYVFLVQNVSDIVCVSGAERFCCSMCFWYRTRNTYCSNNVLYQKHIPQQKRSVPETHTAAEPFCTRNTYCSNNVLYQKHILQQKRSAPETHTIS
jgi:hypothetical protein